MNGRTAAVRDALVSWMDGLLYVFVGPFSVLYVIPTFLLGLDGARAAPGFGLRWLELVGVGAMALGGLVAAYSTWVVLQIGGTPFVGTPPRELIVRGPFRFVRNPMMWALLLVILGESLSSGSLLVMLWLVAWSRIGHRLVVMYEEPQMEQRFGEQYRAYCARVPRWFPRLARRSKGDSEGRARDRGAAG